MEMIFQCGHSRDQAADRDAECEERNRDRGAISTHQSAGSSSKVACSPWDTGSVGFEGLTLAPYLSRTSCDTARASDGSVTCRGRTLIERLPSFSSPSPRAIKFWGQSRPKPPPDRTKMR